MRGGGTPQPATAQPGHRWAPSTPLSAPVGDLGTPSWAQGGCAGGARSPLWGSLDAAELENRWPKAVGSGGAAKMGCKGHATGGRTRWPSPRRDRGRGDGGELGGDVAMPTLCVHTRVPTHALTRVRVAGRHAWTRGGGSGAPPSPACPGGSTTHGTAALPSLSPLPPGTPPNPFHSDKITLTLPQLRFSVSADLEILMVRCHQDTGCCDIGTEPEQRRGGAGGDPPREWEQTVMDTHHDPPSAASLPGMGLPSGPATDPQTPT